MYNSIPIYFVNKGISSLITEVFSFFNTINGIMSNY